MSYCIPAVSCTRPPPPDGPARHCEVHPAAVDPSSQYAVYQVTAWAGSSGLPELTGNAISTGRSVDPADWPVGSMDVPSRSLVQKMLTYARPAADTGLNAVTIILHR